MSDRSISQEEEANQIRAAHLDDAKLDSGILGSVERALSFVREQQDAPDTVEEAEQLRRANDAEQRG